MSSLMKDFLTAWLDWAENSGRVDGPFDPAYGLCTACKDYCESLGMFRLRLIYELESMFVKDGLDEVYPFNGGQGCSYDAEVYGDKIHKNPQRLAWVRKQLELT